MAMSPNVPLVAWQPDADPTQPGVLADVRNMLPTVRGYAPDFALSTAVEATVAGGLPSRCYGASTLRFAQYTPLLFAGTSTDLYSYYGNALYNVSRASPYTAISDPQQAWRFDAYGDVALAINAQNTLQYTTNPYGTNFADVSGGPKAATMCVQSGFVLVANTLSDGSFAYGDGWWCSALNDYTDWTPDLATQCDRGQLRQTPGEIVRLIAFRGEVIAFKKSSMFRGVWVNRPAQGTIWQWTPISTSVGLIGHDAVCDAGGVLYWVAEDGFYAYAGGAVERIKGAPHRWWQGHSTDNVVYRTYTQAVYDPAWRCVRFYYVPYGQFTPELSSGVALHIDSGRWGRFEQLIEWAAQSYYQNVRTPGLPTTVMSQAGAVVVFDTVDHKPYAASEEPGTSSFETGDFGDDDTGITLTGARVRWAKTPTDTEAQHYYRMALGDDLDAGDASEPGDDGIYPFTQSARWHRMTFQQTGWYELLGVSVEAPRAGRK